MNYKQEPIWGDSVVYSLLYEVIKPWHDLNYSSFDFILLKSSNHSIDKGEKMFVELTFVKNIM